jgi:3-keto-5-aminohexanoate cleavage enzyme
MGDLSPDRSMADWIWAGVSATEAEVAAMQPPWNVPSLVAVEADIGHDLDAASVVAATKRAFDAGAGAVHTHIRVDGREVADLSTWSRVVGEIRDACPGIVIDRGLRGETYSEAIDQVRLGLFDIMPIQPVFDPKFVRSAVGEMIASGVVPQMAVFDGTDISLAKSQLMDSGVLEPPTAWLVDPSSPYVGMPMPTPVLMARGLCHLVELIRVVDPDARIMVCCAGRASTYLMAQALILGLDIRPGTGETRWRWPHRDDGSFESTGMVADAIKLAELLGRDSATPGQIRAFYGMKEVD